MLYSVQTYYALKDPYILEKRFKDVELLYRLIREDYDLIQRVIENPEVGREKLKELKEELNGYEHNMRNIISAIELLGVKE